MLLSSPSFSNFLDHLSSNPVSLPQQQAPVKTEQRQEQRQLPKDVNPYSAAQQLQQQQIGMAMIPEQSMDFSMLTLDGDSFTYQPQVFAVLETPEVPASIDTAVLSGKTSNFVGQSFDADDNKVDMPVIENPAAKTQAPLNPEATHAAAAPAVVFDDEFENDPEFALYHSEKPAAQSAEAHAEADANDFAPVDIFRGVESEKILARYELVDASEEEAGALLAMARIQRITASLDCVVARLEALTMDS
jgi:bZIP-type transcription factor MBZ1